MIFGDQHLKTLNIQIDSNYLNAVKSVRFAKFLTEANATCEWMWKLHSRIVVFVFVIYSMLSIISVFICWWMNDLSNIECFYHPFNIVWVIVKYKRLCIVQSDRLIKWILVCYGIKQLIGAILERFVLLLWSASHIWLRWTPFYYYSYRCAYFIWNFSKCSINWSKN